MKKLKQIFNKLFFPHSVIVIFLVPIAAGMLIYAFLANTPIPAVQYVSYILSAYTLITLCARIPFYVKKVKAVKESNEYAARYFSDVALRVKISLYGSFVTNTLYAALQFALGVINQSVWFYALAGYYFLLAVIRFFLLRETRKIMLGKNQVREYRQYRLCGIVLLMMDIALSVIAFYIVCQNRGFSYHYILTIAMAAYTFTTFTTAIVNMVRYRKYNSPIMSAAKQVNFAAALVSMLSLETAMLSAFGETETQIYKRTVTACTGAVVCITILGLALYMLVHSTKTLKSLRINNS